MEEIIRVNKGRWEIEESFRIIKDDFDARSVYVQREFHTDYEILKKRAMQGEIRRSKGLSITRFAKKYKA